MKFTRKQGQCPAFIYNYTKIAVRPPAEADMRHHLRITPSSVHQMVLNLENAGPSERTAGAARTVRVLSQPEELPYQE